MTSPMLTVIVLVVLWLIVVVPMVVRRKDERAGERSVARFGSAMRALASRRSSALAPAAAPGQPIPAERPAPAPVTRRPVPVSKEPLMYPPDRHDMSEPRRQMLIRRRRSLTILGVGAAVMLLVSFITGAMFAWGLEVLLLASLGGYVLFLRAEARRDRSRREIRLQRSSARPIAGYDATAGLPPVTRRSEAIVRIDDDDIELDHLDTVDLTGLYSEVEFDDSQVRRAG